MARASNRGQFPPDGPTRSRWLEERKDASSPFGRGPTAKGLESRLVRPAAAVRSGVAAPIEEAEQTAAVLEPICPVSCPVSTGSAAVRDCPAESPFQGRGAEAEGFEPSRSCPLAVLKTAGSGRRQTSQITVNKEVAVTRVGVGPTPHCHQPCQEPVRPEARALLDLLTVLPPDLQQALLKLAGAAGQK